MCFDCNTMISCNCEGGDTFGKCPASYGLYCSVCDHASRKAVPAPAAAGTVTVGVRVLEDLLKPETLAKMRAKHTKVVECKATHQKCHSASMNSYCGREEGHGDRDHRCKECGAWWTP